MNRRTFLALAFSAAAFAATASLTPVRADVVADLVKLIKEAGASGNPAMAFIKGVGTLGDVSLDQAQVREALVLSGAPAGGMIDKLLRPTKKLQKRGKKITIERSEVTKLSPLTPDGMGAVEIGKTVSAKVTITGPNDATIDDVKGIKVGETATDLYDMKSVKFTKEGGKPVAKVTAGFLFITKTVTIDLSPSNLGNTRGLVDSVPQ